MYLRGQSFYASHANLGADPELRRISVDGEQRDVTNLRLRLINATGEGDARKDHGFWVDGEAWGTLAAAAAQHLSKGAYVFVCGELLMHHWMREGEPRTQPKLKVSYIGPDLRGVEQVTFREKGDTVASESASTAEEGAHVDA